MNAATLPAIIPVFPLQGALLLPGGQMPLNIFEPRYRAMTEDAVGGDKLIGMIQPRLKERLEPEDRPDLFRTGCVGRITQHEALPDGRHAIVLTGLCRFDIRRELPPLRGYRRVEADFAPYGRDFADGGGGTERTRLFGALAAYLDRRGLKADWKQIEAAPVADLIDALAVSCPFGAAEKQALLEAADRDARARTLLSLFALDGAGPGEAGPPRPH